MKKIFFWDFDGVIMNSNEVRDFGFQQVLKDYPQDQVTELMNFHKLNGGLSRYVKFRYFFENIRNESISDGDILLWSKKFSDIMLQQLIDPILLIDETIKFIINNYKKYRMHVVSGSDQNELRFICTELGIAKYFKTIHGSPTPKNDLVTILMADNGYNSDDCILIGDSINDYDAAIKNQISFMAYNNEKLNNLSNMVISFD